VKVVHIGNEFGYSTEELSKQNVKEVVLFLLIS
jgi:hypothetical protein